MSLETYVDISEANSRADEKIRGSGDGGGCGDGGGVGDGSGESVVDHALFLLFEFAIADKVVDMVVIVVVFLAAIAAAVAADTDYH
ncbi:Hypothetical predicted protein [Octopus vulgaris]|uniref:Uncharacterized protein n=1 Tax=Octopus vulgaris TaxID=6645 RepID=A0AA36AGB8_OCTVU|nr:Hypothetical predicted protein [Octopus vulgaris]